MLTFLFGLLSASFAIIVASLYRVFGHVSSTELKRRARQGDTVAAVLYRAVSYGLGVKLVLFAVIFGSAYLAVVMLIDSLGAWLALPTVAVLVAFGAAFIGSKDGANQLSLWLATWISPALAWLVERLHPVFNRLARISRRLFPVRVHSGLYERQDLISLIEQQQKQADNRIPAGELDLVAHALTFGGQKVADAVVPKRVVKTVSVDDAVGPVLMGELHASGHSRFPVYEVKKDTIVGVLYLHDLVAEKQSGVVRDVMRRKLTYVHEEFSLYETLQAFIKTKHHLFLVVNKFEEYVGIITIEDVLERVIGKLIIDEFDQYDDLRAVAAKAAGKDHARRERDHLDAEAAAEGSEVVQ